MIGTAESGSVTRRKCSGRFSSTMASSMAFPERVLGVAGMSASAASRACSGFGAAAARRSTSARARPRVVNQRA